MAGLSLATPRPDSAAARECGTCGMCCKVYDIPVLNKPEGQWCPNCIIGGGCTIYDARPDYCRAFRCLWIDDRSIPPEWKPEVSKIVLSVYPTNGFIYAQVDAAAPFAWRKEPYFSQLRAWSAQLLKQRRHVLVFVKRDATLIMPTGPVPIGPMSPEDGFVIRETFTPAGKGYTVERRPRAG